MLGLLLATTENLCPVSAYFYGTLGMAAAMIFSCFGAAYGTAKSGVGVSAAGVMRPEFIMKSVIPVIFAGALPIYGVVVAIVYNGAIVVPGYPAFLAFHHLAGGLSVGMAALGAGFAIGIVGDAGVRGNAQQPQLFIGMALILIFAECLGLYGLIIAVVLNKAIPASFSCN